jgi:hypothetical protein
MYNLQEVQEIRDGLDPRIVDDILEDNCHVVVNFGIQNENYVYDIIAEHIGKYDKFLVMRIFDKLEELLKLEVCFTKTVLENFKMDPAKYASAIDKKNNMLFLISNDPHNAEVHVLCSTQDGTFDYVCYSEVSEFNEIDNCIEIVFDSGDKVTYFNN